MSILRPSVFLLLSVGLLCAHEWEQPGKKFGFREASGATPPVAPEPKPTARAAETSANPVGEWRGIKKTGGVLVISADGKYTINGGTGEYRMSGNQITFTGPLAIWNSGKAALKNGVIEFSWTNPAGAKRLFAFAKAR